MERFDLTSSSLTGRSLIEASAGTGKTYAISGLFLRLVVEQGFPVNEILVVTYTEAATEELRDRIRGTLHAADRAFATGNSPSPLLQELLRRENPSRSRARLLTALRSFDEAAIFTIHGFCHRILQECAFESGALFDNELLSDQFEYLAEISADYWRRHFYETSLPFAAYALAKNFTLETLVKMLADHLQHPELEVIPRVGAGDTTELEKRYLEDIEDARRLWSEHRADVEGILSDHKSLNRQRYKKTSVGKWVAKMDAFLEGDRNPALPGGFQKFTTDSLAANTKKREEPPQHPFFDTCERIRLAAEALCEAYDRRLLGHKRRFLDYARRELRLRKQRQGLLSFDDLLLNVRDALRGAGGERLATSLREKFKAALIDEFQDTDPLQYEIFDRIYSSPESLLFLIGDPKQAIYGFRGADVFAYLRARGQADSRYTLGTNWRSEPRLVRALNTVFSRPRHPFVFEAIGFEHVEPSPEREAKPLEIDGRRDEPFRLWFLDQDGDGWNKGEASETIRRRVAAEIARLLNLGAEGRARLDDRPLEPSDVAVLVRKNDQAWEMQKALHDVGVRSVLQSTESLFLSREALQVERLLAAIARPQNESLLRAALATDVLGFSGEDLNKLSQDELLWEPWLEKCRQYRERWSREGILRMLRELIEREGVRQRLLGFPDGERRLTNVLHLSEVLHRAETEGQLGLSSLERWLAERRRAETASSKEQEIRLESDANAVKLVTIHKSKGLEYPVVFCPFAWGGSRRNRNQQPDCVFHEDSDLERLTLDLGSEDLAAHRKLAEEESLAENLRLLYVALTRASHRVYLVWGRIKDAGTSAIAYLLHPMERRSSGGRSPGVVDELAAHMDALDDGAARADLEELATRSEGTIRVTPMPRARDERYTRPLPEAEKLDCRRPSRKLGRDWRVASFSSLVSGRAHVADLPDRDATTPDEAPEPDAPAVAAAEPGVERRDISEFPRGAHAGNFFHDVLEHLDYTEKDPSPVGALVREKLRAHGFDEGWAEVVRETIGKVLSVPLPEVERDFTLSRLSAASRINELEFYFPLGRVTAPGLKAVLAGHGGLLLPAELPDEIGRLTLSPVQGFMKGYVDLAFEHRGRFYLVDWKSNFLGATVESYCEGALTSAMVRHLYILQYLVYSVALSRHLALRVPRFRYERHFGGVYYIFLRGVDPQRGPRYGIHQALPSTELVRELDRYLSPGGAQG